MRIVSFVTTFKTLLLLNDFNNYLDMVNVYSLLLLSLKWAYNFLFFVTLGLKVLIYTKFAAHISYNSHV